MISENAFRYVQNLKDHERVLKTLLSYFHEFETVVGAIVSGSVAAGGMDEWSDLDVGIVFASPEARETEWQRRSQWTFYPKVHQLDATHIKPHFVITFFDPNIKTDLSFYTLDTLPSLHGAPYAVAFDRSNKLEAWARHCNEAFSQQEPDWSNVQLEDERYWAWTYYRITKIHRGEYLHLVVDCGMLRELVFSWEARLSGLARFDNRRIEKRLSTEVFELYKNTLPSPDPKSLVSSMFHLHRMQMKNRARVKALLNIEWRTDGKMIALVEDSMKKLTSLR